MEDWNTGRLGETCQGLEDLAESEKNETHLCISNV